MKIILSLQIFLIVILLTACNTTNQPTETIKEVESSNKKIVINLENTEHAENTTIANIPENIPENTSVIPDTTIETTEIIPAPPVAPPVKTTITVIGVGDMMLGTNYPSIDYLPKNNGKDLLKAVNGVLNDADVTFGNLEGSVTNTGTTTKNCKNCYAFRMPDNLADNLSVAGFDVVSVANNHSMDFGYPGAENTLKVLANLGIYSAGFEGKNESVIFEKDGITYGMAAFAPNYGTVKIHNITKAKTIVSNLAQKADIVIVSFHGGAEGTKYQNMTRQVEYYFGENRGNVYEFAHAVIDAGADVVFGHGPHVTRAIEVYKNRFIAYSLGNFSTYGRFNLTGEKGIAPIIKVFMHKDGSFIKAQIIPTKQIPEVVIDTNKGAIKTLQRLIKEDGFDHNIKISDDGLVTMR